MFNKTDCSNAPNYGLLMRLGNEFARQILAEPKQNSLDDYVK